MKYKIIFVAFIALIAGTFSSCKKDNMDSYPILYVVNTSDYTIQFYCDNSRVVTTLPHDNSKITLSSVPINRTVFLQMYCFDNYGDLVKRTDGIDYKFNWNKTYKLTAKNTGYNIQEL